MNKLFIKLINLYQKIRKGDNKSYCRFTPSCSEYAKKCFMKFNFFKAFILSIYRILRCNPLSKGGYDPVPLTKLEKIEYNKKTEQFFKTINLDKIYIVNHI